MKFDWKRFLGIKKVKSKRDPSSGRVGLPPEADKQNDKAGV